MHLTARFLKEDGRPLLLEDAQTEMEVENRAEELHGVIKKDYHPETFRKPLAAPPLLNQQRRQLSAMLSECQRVSKKMPLSDEFPAVLSELTAVLEHLKKLPEPNAPLQCLAGKEFSGNSMGDKQPNFFSVQK